MSTLAEVKAFQRREHAKRKAGRGLSVQARLRLAVKELEFIADQWGHEFDNDEPINGADFVQWFAEMRPGLLEVIRKVKL